MLAHTLQRCDEGPGVDVTKCGEVNVHMDAAVRAAFAVSEHNVSPTRPHDETVVAWILAQRQQRCGSNHEQLYNQPIHVR